MKFLEVRQQDPYQVFVFSDTDSWGRTSAAVKVFVGLDSKVLRIEFQHSWYGFAKWKSGSGFTQANRWEDEERLRRAGDPYPKALLNGEISVDASTVWIADLLKDIPNLMLQTHLLYLIQQGRTDVPFDFSELTGPKDA